MTKKKDTHPNAGEEEQQAEAMQAEQAAAVADQEEEAAGKPEVCSKEEEYYRQLISLKADFENYRKRVEREKPLFIKYGKEEVIQKFIPLYETLLKAKAELGKEDVSAEHIKQGLKMIFEEFGKVFKSEGVEVVSYKGKPYDPMTQEAITTVPCDDKDDGMVVEELSGGVIVDGKVLRPAQVIVGKKKEQE